jgi:hypothetical protein
MLLVDLLTCVTFNAISGYVEMGNLFNAISGYSEVVYF